MQKGFEDVIQCQSNLQEMHLGIKNSCKTSSLKLISNNHHQTQIDEHKARIQELKTQNQELKTQNEEHKMHNELILKMIEQAAWGNDIQYRSSLRYVYKTICLKQQDPSPGMIQKYARWKNLENHINHKFGGVYILSSSFEISIYVLVKIVIFSSCLICNTSTIFYVIIMHFVFLVASLTHHV